VHADVVAALRPELEQLATNTSPVAAQARRLLGGGR
jgi:hypothetical protein